MYLHIERHGAGRVVHALSEGTSDDIGRRVPLTEHPDTADLADSLDETGDSRAAGIDQLTAAYIPSMLPNGLHRGPPLGRSDYQGVTRPVRQPRRNVVVLDARHPPRPGPSDCP